ncbi:hypothetical protein [Fluviispira vulneris]|uniref:hypothetical protein n=1 Tax=Fluviispira vulneris TaxID=2763012 RepID=UPI001644FA7D|nr:hypothetical protein [Fluviispira vulneris]
MKIVKPIILLLLLISFNNCSKNPSSSSTNGVPNNGAGGGPKGIDPNVFREENRATFIRPYEKSIVNKLADLWEIRKRLEANLNYYNNELVIADRPKQSWLESLNENFFHTMERIYNYRRNELWKFKPLIDDPLNEVILQYTYEVANNDSGRSFIRELTTKCQFHELRVGSRLFSSMREKYEIIDPCIYLEYKSAWEKYDEAANDDTDMNGALNKTYPNSPFIFRGPVGGEFVSHPLLTQEISGRSQPEKDYIKYLRKKVAEAFTHYMNQPINVGENPLKGNNPLRAPNFNTFNLSFDGENHLLNLMLDRQYFSSSNNIGLFFIAINPAQSKLIDAVFKSIKDADEEKFIIATVKLAASHPAYHQRNIVLESFPELFITKDFKNYQLLSSYMHYLLNCTQFG